MRRARMGVVVTLLLAPALAACPAKVHGHPKVSAPITISISGATRVHTGDLLSLRATLASLSGKPAWTGISWGDGGKGAPIYAEGPCDFGQVSPGPSPSVPPPPETSALLFAHRYRQPGTYSVVITADEFMICDRKSPHGSGRMVVKVVGAPALGNGVADPNPGVGILGYKNGVVSGDVGAEDPDGYVRSITVTWPNGATHTFFNSAPCHDPGNGWPSSNALFHWTQRMVPGTYTIKAVAVSTDCNGGSIQTITDLRPFRLSRTGWSNYGPNVFLPHEPRDNGMLSQGMPACCPIREATGS